VINNLLLESSKYTMFVEFRVISISEVHIPSNYQQGITTEFSWNLNRT